MAAKARHTVLNMQQRLDILNEFKETGLTTVQIAKKYGVHKRTILRIKKNAIQINSFANKSKREKNRRKIMEPVYDELDKRLLVWFTERRALGHSFTDALIQDKATEMKKDLPGYSRFQVSRGWLASFKRRHGIRLVNVDREKPTVDQKDAIAFVNTFKTMIKKENIRLENIYNMDETGLVWKALPTKTLAGRNERSISESLKSATDRITVGFCANALGTHKLMPLVVYKYKNPRALKHEVSLPVVFKAQLNASMDRKLFVDWFENHFKPSVKDFQEQNQISGTVMLLLDNCETHKAEAEIEDPDFKIMYLPSNITSLIQPMEQGIIERTKKNFRHKLLQRVLTYDDGVNAFYKDYTLKNCIDILAKSWSEITQNNVKNAWNKIIGPTSNCAQPVVEPEPDLQEVMSLVVGEEYEQEDVAEFLANCEQEEGKSNEDCAEQVIVKEEPLQVFLEENLDGPLEELLEEPLEDPLQQHSEEPSEMVYEGHSNEFVRKELGHIFKRLVFFSARAPPCIQCIVEGLKIFFLGKEY